MKLKLLRTRLFKDRTIGQLYVDDEFFCFTLEDPVRKEKIDGDTAIPEGRYRVSLEDSPKFGPNTITVHNVPGFTGVRMHAGNTAKDTRGCPLLGYRLTKDFTAIAGGTSRPAVADLKLKLKGLTVEMDIVSLA